MPLALLVLIVLMEWRTWKGNLAAPHCILFVLSEILSAKLLDLWGRQSCVPYPTIKWLVEGPNGPVSSVLRSIKGVEDCHAARSRSMNRSWLACRYDAEQMMTELCLNNDWIMNRSHLVKLCKATGRHRWCGDSMLRMGRKQPPSFLAAFSLNSRYLPVQLYVNHA